jgi:hypothetical protein
MSNENDGLAIKTLSADVNRGHLYVVWLDLYHNAHGMERPHS